MCKKLLRKCLSVSDPQTMKKARYHATADDVQARLRGPLILAAPEGLPDTVAERLQTIADEHPDAEIELVGGLEISVRQ